MKVIDNGFGLDHTAIKYAVGYEDTAAMFDASYRLERRGGKSLAVGALAVVTGAVLHKVGLPIDGTIKEIGEDIVIGAGVLIGSRGALDLIGADGLQDFAGHIDWGVAEGTVTIGPDEAPAQ